MVEQGLSQSLNRPVQVGQLEWLGLTNLRVGPSSIPATPTDPDHVTVQGIEVRYNLLQILATRNLNLDITLNQPNLFLEQDPSGQWVSTQIQAQKEETPIRTDVASVQIKDATATLVSQARVKGKPVPVAFSEVNGQLKISDRNQQFTYTLKGQSKTGGTFQISGKTRQLETTKAATPLLETDLKIQAKDFSVPEVDRLLNLPQITLQAGRVSGNISAQLKPNQKLPILGGTAKFKDVSLAIDKVPQPFTQAKGTLDLQGQQLRLSNASGYYGKIAATVSGTLDPVTGFNLAASTQPVSVPVALTTLNIQSPIPVKGEIQTDLKLTGPLETPVLSGVVRSTQAGQLGPIALTTYSANFQLNVDQQLLKLSQIQAKPASGGKVTGFGRIELAPDPSRTQVAFAFDVNQAPADPIARQFNGGKPLPVQLGRVNAQAQITGTASQPKTFVSWQAPSATYAGRGEILVANGVTTLSNTRFDVAGGQVNLDARVANGRWQATVDGSQIALKAFSPDLRGQFDGRFVATGNLSSFSPSSVQAKGEARFSEGLALVSQPLTAQVRWDGQKLLVDNATAPGLSLDGTILARLEGPGAPVITGMDLNVQANNFDLKALGLSVPSVIAYSGSVDFNGRVSGTPTKPRVVGDLALRQFKVNEMEFEPVMTGQVRLDQGVSLEVAGQQDRIAASLDAAFRPQSFTIQNAEAIASGQVQGNQFLVDLSQISLAQVSPPGLSLVVPISGKLDGKLALNLQTWSGTGNVAIANPAVSTYRADKFSSQFQFSQGVATLSNGTLNRGKTSFLISGKAAYQGPDPKLEAKIATQDAQVQDVLELAQIFNLEDFSRGIRPPAFGSAADLQTTPAGLPEAPIFDQIRRIAEIKALLALEAAKRKEAPIPPLAELQGTFGGELSLTASAQTGINGNFNFQGQNWVWGPYQAKQVVAIGTLEKGVLSVLPLRFQTDQSVVSFSGEVGPEQQTGQFRMENIPLESVAELLRLPLNVEGKLNATATLAGTVQNPQLLGELNFSDAFLNGTAIDKAQGAFRYANSRLDFGNRIFISGPEPINILGSLPYQLPFSSVKPDSDRISLDVNVRDDGLAFLNVLTNQLAWVNGKGAVDIKVRGTLKQPIANGTVVLKDAKFTARALPEPLTGVTGLIRFNFDRAEVQNLQGQFSQGTVVAKGFIPIANPQARIDPAQEPPLTVSMDNIRLNLKGIYSGGVDGNLVVTGSLLNPELGGLIQLQQGQILLSEQSGASLADSGPQGQDANLAFKDLKLKLGNRMRVTLPPLLNFVATGDLSINGPLTDLQPSGTISLVSGQVNLFTTQFFLERGYPQTATFEPQRGLDPVLDIRLRASVPEVTRQPAPTTANPSEILDTPSTATGFGALQTVRVQARIDGPASQLADNLQLTSSPPRSPSEIVSLIGGSYVNTLGRGDTALGIANLAGSALLTNIQFLLANALGLTQFRLFPAFVPQESRNRQDNNSSTTTTLGLGAEVGFDLTPSLSVSVLKLLTSNNDPAQFTLRYRVSDQLLLRGSTNFSGDDRAVLEYESRF